MSGYDETQLARLLRSLSPAPEDWVRAARELPIAGGEVVAHRARSAERARRSAPVPAAQGPSTSRADEVLDTLAAGAPVAALVAASAAALVALAARRSADRTEGAGIIAQAETLRTRAASLVEADVDAADANLRVAQVAADIAALAAVAAEHEDARSDAAAAAALAHGAARAAAQLVATELAAAPADERTAAAQAYADWAAAAADRAFKGGGA